MQSLYWLITFLLLTALFVIVGSRDLVGFFRIGLGRSSRYLLWLILVLWLGGIGLIIYLWPPTSITSLSDFFWARILAFSLLILLLAGIFSSLRRRGPGRVWALSWLTFREAMSQRAWLAVPLWLIGVLVVGLFISPYRLVQDRMMLTTELLVRGQLLVAGILILGLACRSIPRELEKKTITVTASKPINMLELVAGKLLGFLLLGLVLVAAMGLLSYGILWYNGQQVRKQARRELAAQQAAYQVRQRELPPDADLQDIAASGVLYARDPVYPVAPLGFNGKFDPNFDQLPCIKGGTFSKIEWRFTEIPVVDRWPWLFFSFLVERLPEEIPHKEDFEPGAPLTVKIEAASARFPRRSRIRKEVEVPPPAGVADVGLSQPIGFPLGGQLVLDPVEWGDLYNVGPVIITVSFPVHGHNLYFRNESLQLANLTPQVPSLGVDQTRMVAPEAGQARVVAKTFKNAQEISGTAKGQPEVAYWHFANIDPGTFPPGDTLRFEMQTYSERSDAVKSHTLGLVRAIVVKPDRTRVFWPGPEDIPQAVLGSEELAGAALEQARRDWPGWQPVVMQERRPTAVRLPKSLFAKDSDVYVFLACGLSDGWIALGDKSGYLARNRRSFAVNVLRCQVIIFLQVAAIAAVAVMASSFLSWPVACFLSMVIYLIGAARESLQGVVTFWGTASEAATNYVIGMLGAVLPDFSAYKVTEFIAEGEVIGLDKLAGLFSRSVFWALGLVVLAYLFIRCRELAK